MTRNGHVRFGERSRETHSSRGEKVRSAPTLLSPLLANIALFGMEEALINAYMDGKKTLSARQGAPKLIRYADDFVVLHVEVVEVLKAQQLIATWLEGIGLELKPSKTRLSYTLKEYQGNVGFNFLGFVRHESCTRGCYD